MSEKVFTFISVFFQNYILLFNFVQDSIFEDVFMFNKRNV